MLMRIQLHVEKMNREETEVSNILETMNVVRIAAFENEQSFFKVGEQNPVRLTVKREKQTAT